VPSLFTTQMRTRSIDVRITTAVVKLPPERTEAWTHIYRRLIETAIEMEGNDVGEYWNSGVFDNVDPVGAALVPMAQIDQA
jgi:hypothetical protein